MTNFTSIRHSTVNFFQDAFSLVKEYGSLGFRKISQSNLFQNTLPQLFNSAISIAKDTMNSISGMDSTTKRNVALIAAGTTLSVLVIQAIWKRCRNGDAPTRM